MVAFIALLILILVFVRILIVGEASNTPVYILLLFQFLSLPIQVRIWLKKSITRNIKLKCFLLYGAMASVWWLMIVYSESSNIHSVADVLAPFMGIIIFGGLFGWIALLYLKYKSNKNFIIKL
jgi:hypothetical protein